MIVVTLIFILMTIRVRKPLRLFHYITILITLTSGLAYFLMAAGTGRKFALVNIIHHDNGPTELIFRQIYWARYLEWAITTPLILVNLTVLAGLPGAEILLAIYADVAMILFVSCFACQSNVKGLFAAFEHRRLQWGYFAISVVFYLYVIFTLFLSARHAAIARNQKVGRLFTAMSTYTVIIWTLYPIVWVLGEGTQRITVNTEIIMYAVLDVLSKAVFGGWLLVSHLWIQEGHVPLTGWWIEGSGNIHGSAAERRGLLDDD